MANWDLSDVTRLALAFRDERDWGQFHRPKELAAGLAIEAAELQELFLWRDGEDATAVRADEERTARIAEELADVAVYVLLLAHDLDLPLADVIEAKLAANALRYPVERYKGSAEKAPH